MGDTSVGRPRVGVDIEEVLAFQAPYLIERLVTNRTADDEQDALALVDAVKHFLILVGCEPTVAWSMYSLRVDEAWHQFILYTEAYAAFCDRFFGRYLSHVPQNAPTPAHDGSASVEHEELPTFAEFQARYQELFGHPLPDVWFDERSIRPWRRALNVHAGTWTVSDAGEKVALIAADGRRMLSMSGFARDALTFLAQTGAFYVRELPGGLSDAEKVSLISTLVGCELLKIAA